MRLIISDIDGVWTDGRLYYTHDGREMKVFHARDGLGVRLAQRAGILVAVVTARSSKALERRCRELDITEVVQGAANKREATAALLERLGVAAEDTCYIGDDLPDIPPMRLCGFSAAPADAAPEVLAVARWRLDARGGQGAFREAVEKVLHHTGAWERVLGDYLDE